MLQQYLPFTVLKLHARTLFTHKIWTVATVPTVYGIETYNKGECKIILLIHGCNSTYRLRY